MLYMQITYACKQTANKQTYEACPCNLHGCVQSNKINHPKSFVFPFQTKRKYLRETVPRTLLTEFISPVNISR